MADSAHLEKMGRELKCPICLSLLNSAVSLTCNHVFCNLCIMESMKSDSHCPVCKVPYRRREVRAAPHMDTLVSIYKSMEVASGINMFVTQTTPVKTSEAGKSQAEGERGNGRPETVSHGKQNKRRTFKGEGLKELVKTNVETSDPNSKPSFPAKKRVHVPQCLLPGTRPHPEQCEGLKDGSIVLKEKPDFNEMGEPVLSPFFWLREEDDNDDVERLSCQRTQDDLFMDTTPPNAPCFSDIKDSDDEIPTKMTPISQSKVANIFDSEMFEWTQRACSPELCSTPVKSQVAYEDKLNRINDDKCEISSQIWTASNGEEPLAESAKPNKGSLSSLKTKKAETQSGRKTLNRRDKRINGRSQKKHVKLSMDEVPIDSSKIDPNLGKKTCNRNKRAIFDMIDVNKETKHAISEPIEEKIHNQGNEIIRTVWPDLSCENLENVDKRQLKTIRSIKKIIGNQKSHYKGPKHENQGNENATKAGKAFILEDKSSNLGKKFDIPVSKKCKRLKISLDDCAKNVLVDKSLVEASKPSANEAQIITGLQKDLMIRCTDNLEITKNVLSVAKDRFLQKCESFPGKIKCAFCQSSINSEASGEMMHYVNGRPVAPDYNEGSNIVHSHKNCTEWAPNVYFEDDIAINLETELARSRRIRCSCCGIKGAALGCYEKSCRKSFHVPCAKLVPQCRWDTENFVMLCPLHTSMKFPKEIAGFEGKRRKKAVPKGGSQAKKAEVMTQHVSESGLWKWPGSPNKWVICSSGLTVAEKVIVSDFSKMAGVLMSPTFGPNVTHIIASTDENGACKRTLKFLMGILEGKWILKIDWVKACMKAMEPVAEEQYEISVDIHGIRDGPRLGRLRVLSKQPKLFNGYKFYFMGEFIPSYKGYLQDLVVAAGGTVLQRKPISEDFFGSSAMSTFIIYNLELTEDCDSRKKTICKCRQDDAEALASSTGAKVAGHSWVLDSIAASKLHNLIK